MSLTYPLGVRRRRRCCGPWLGWPARWGGAPRPGGSPWIHSGQGSRGGAAGGGSGSGGGRRAVGDEAVEGGARCRDADQCGRVGDPEEDLLQEVVSEGFCWLLHRRR
jgi:hypothetical protein